jgi:anthranilate synthase component 1
VKKERILTQIESLAGMGLDPLVAFARLNRRGEPAFLFESSHATTREKAYTVLGVRPLETVASRGGRLYLRKRGLLEAKLGAETPLVGNPVDLLEGLLNRFTRVSTGDLPPFAGGMVGALGFEFSRHLEPVVDSTFGTSGTDAEFMLIGTHLVFDHLRDAVLLVGTVFLDREAESEGKARIAHEFRRLRAALGRKGEREKSLHFRRAAAPRKFRMNPALGAKAFTAAVGEIKAKIRRGDLFQCVISERFQFPLRLDPLRVFAALEKVGAAPYRFYVDFGKSLLLGASPERLVSVDGDLVETHPIAGTRPRGKDTLSDLRFERQLLASVKERAEHAMLVDLGRNDIGRVAVPGTVAVKEFMQVRRFSHVMHLVSTVQGRLAPRDTSFRALTACFPAGTLSGAPKISAIKTIAGLEPTSRGVYGGALMLQDFSGRLDSCIIIRSLSLEGETASVQAGAGIVADSVAKREYEEVRNKTRAVVRAVELALSGSRV